MFFCSHPALLKVDYVLEGFSVKLSFIFVKIIFIFVKIIFIFIKIIFIFLKLLFFNFFINFYCLYFQIVFISFYCFYFYNFFKFHIFLNFFKFHLFIYSNRSCFCLFILLTCLYFVGIIYIRYLSNSCSIFWFCDLLNGYFVWRPNLSSQKIVSIGLEIIL